MNIQKEKCWGIASIYNRMCMNHERLNHCRPGVTRLSFPYFMSRASMDYVIKAVAMVAKHGWKLLPQVSIGGDRNGKSSFIYLSAPDYWTRKENCSVWTARLYLLIVLVNAWALPTFSLVCTQYLFNPETGMFRHHRHHFSRDRCWLSSISYDSGEMVYIRSAENSPPSFEVGFLMSAHHCG